MQVLMAGASGTIGRALRIHLLSQGNEIRTLVRRPPQNELEYTWSGQIGSVPAKAIIWADAVVSLNGAPIARIPWTKAYRQQIMTSRVDPAAALARAIARSECPPAVWVCASATGIYGDRRDLTEENPQRGLCGQAATAGAMVTLTEASPPGTGFLAAVVRAWEAAALPAANATRLVLARTGMVLGPGDGALRAMMLATKCGLGVRFGNGRQYWPWISLRDEVRAWDCALRNEDLTGPVNLVGPAPATADQITAALAHQLHRPRWLVAPAPLLRMAMDGAAEDLLLASQPVQAAVLETHGFEFLDRTAESAVRTALSGLPEGETPEGGFRTTP
jgi:NAD dependent epimerase/dehydratase family enzyme